MYEHCYGRGVRENGRGAGAVCNPTGAFLHAHDTADEVWLGVPVVGRRGELGEKLGMTHEMGSRVTVGKDRGAVTGRFSGGGFAGAAR
jgi:hypothetical protein